MRELVKLVSVPANFAAFRVVDRAVTFLVARIFLCLDKRLRIVLRCFAFFCSIAVSFFGFCHAGALYVYVGTNLVLKASWSVGVPPIVPPPLAAVYGRTEWVCDLLLISERLLVCEAYIIDDAKLACPTGDVGSGILNILSIRKAALGARMLPSFSFGGTGNLASKTSDGLSSVAGRFSTTRDRGRLIYGGGLADHAAFWNAASLSVGKLFRRGDRGFNCGVPEPRLVGEPGTAGLGSSISSDSFSAWCIIALYFFFPYALPKY